MELYLPLVLDGATGTQLQKRGFTGGVCTEQWVLEHPEAILAVQRDYIEAGSNIVYAPTFSANRVKLGESGLAEHTSDFNRRLAALSRQAAGGRALVAGDIAPTGKFLSPIGDAGFDELVDIYTEQAAALEAGGVDLFVIETTMTLPEARAALLAVKSVSEKPVFVTFTCDAGGHTLTGTDVTAALSVMQGMGADAFGLNCSVGPEDMLVQLRRLRKIAQIPLIAKPNAGLPEVIGGQTVYRCTPEEFIRCLPEFAAAGVGVFGGCCGTGPEHIREIARVVPTLRIAPPAPERPDLLPAATEKKLFLLPPDTACGTVLPCDDHLADALEELDESVAVVGVRVTRESELPAFAANQYAVDRPLCVFCEDAALLERVLRLYQGRALYEGSLPETVLRPLGEKYGLLY